VLKIENLRKKYKKFEVLRGLNMNLEKGDVYGFLGRNGCGKTTTMNIICNIIPKDEGKISFSPPVGETDTPLKEGGENPKIGYLTETPALYGFMNGFEYLRYIASCANYSSDINKRVQEVLDVVGMTGAASRKIKGYSRGMTQRLGIAAAIFDNPQLLILDEPTSALDPEGRTEVMNIIQNLKTEGTTIILCTHIITDVERVANRIGIMKDGLIVEEGLIEDVMMKHRSQSQQIVVRFTSPDNQAAGVLRSLPNVTASHYNEKNGQLVLNADVPELLYDDIISVIHEKKIKISEFIAQRTTLEDVYMAVTGLRGGAA